VDVIVIVKVGVIVDELVNVGDTENVGDMVGDNVLVLVIVIVGVLVGVPCGPGAETVLFFLQLAQAMIKTRAKINKTFPFIIPSLIFIPGVIL
jgi:hypothetical protein